MREQKKQKREFHKKPESAAKEQRMKQAEPVREGNKGIDLAENSTKSEE